MNIQCVWKITLRTGKDIYIWKPRWPKEDRSKSLLYLSVSFKLYFMDMDKLLKNN
jgi:hypothetical protein